MWRIAPLLLIALLQIAAAHRSATTSIGRFAGIPPAFSATTQLLGPSGELRGTAALTATGNGTRVVAQLDGLLPGPYSIELHQTGRCEGDGFAAAGGSIASSAKTIVGVNGSTTIELTIDGRPFTGGAHPVLGSTGAAVVLASGPRDGQAPKAIACGALAPH